MIVQTESPDYNRDINSKALLANDLGRLAQYKSKVSILNQVISDINTLKKEMRNIKESLLAIK